MPKLQIEAWDRVGVLGCFPAVSGRIGWTLRYEKCPPCSILQVLCWEFALIRKFCGGAWGPLAAACGDAWRRVWQDV